MQNWRGGAKLQHDNLRFRVSGDQAGPTNQDQYPDSDCTESGGLCRHGVDLDIEDCDRCNAYSLTLFMESESSPEL